MEPLADGEVRIYTLDGGRDIERPLRPRILAASLGIDVSALEIVTGPQGKPLLMNDPTLYFSVSHSDAVSMIALTRVAPVGVDVERIRSVPAAERILMRFFPSEDVAAIWSSGDRESRFVRAWTRAEAIVKVRGASMWEAATPDPSVTVKEVVAPDGYAASVAVRSAEWYVRQVQYDLAMLV